MDFELDFLDCRFCMSFFVQKGQRNISFFHKTVDF